MVGWLTGGFVPVSGLVLSSQRPILQCVHLQSVIHENCNIKHNYYTQQAMYTYTGGGGEFIEGNGNNKNYN